MTQLDKAKSVIGNESVTFCQGDIQSIVHTADRTLQGKFDAVFSSATFHWCKSNPGGVIDGAKWLLKPGGRLVFEMGGFGNT
jgi:SAM-dependent methyltransferase